MIQTVRGNSSTVAFGTSVTRRQLHEHSLEVRYITDRTAAGCIRILLYLGRFESIRGRIHWDRDTRGHAGGEAKLSERFEVYLKTINSKQETRSKTRSVCIAVWFVKLDASHEKSGSFLVTGASPFGNISQHPSSTTPPHADTLTCS